jgi:hypothetical protein
MTIHAVLINDVAVDLSEVEYDVRITHARSDIRSQPEASTAQVILRNAPALSVDIGDELRIGAYSGVCRFRGTVTDLTLDHLSTTPATPVVTVTAIGFLAKLGLLTTGEDAYGKEVVRDRVDAVMADAGLSYLNAADNVLELKSNNEPGVQPKINYLQTLAEWSGGTFFDDCRGRIIFEDYGERGIAGNPGIWENAPEPFSFYTQAWDAFPANNAAPQLPASAIAWTPTWRKDLQTLINDIEVEYGNESLYELVDNGSIAAYGRRQYDLKTELFGLTDAQERAQQILAAQAQPLWNLGQISILMNKLTTEQRDRALALLSGSRVIINGLPAGSPYTQFQGIVEGWSETYLPGSHVLTLSLSDPRYSYQVVEWDELDPAIEWGQVNPDITWYAVVNADDLLAA